MKRKVSNTQHLSLSKLYIKCQAQLQQMTFLNIFFIKNSDDSHEI